MYQFPNNVITPLFPINDWLFYTAYLYRATYPLQPETRRILKSLLSGGKININDYINSHITLYHPASIAISYSNVFTIVPDSAKPIFTRKFNNAIADLPLSFWKGFYYYVSPPVVLIQRSHLPNLKTSYQEVASFLDRKDVLFIKVD